MKLKLPNKRTLLTAAVAASLIYSCCTATVSLLYTKKLIKSVEESDIGKSETRITVAAPMIASDAIYTLYECGGKIGIYDAKSRILIDIIDVMVSTLPEADRLSLKKGIDIYAFSDLAQIIEDFSS